MNNVSYNVNTDVVTSNNYYITLQNSCQPQYGTPVQFFVLFFQLIYLVTCSFSQ